jgi:Flp pilus assembly protein TadD
MRIHTTWPTSLLLLALATAGCAKPAHPEATGNYQTVTADPRRNTELASQLNAKGLEELAERDYAKAEKLFREALQADMFFGPAHNNLGIAYYEQQKYYLAAWEFDYARKLMPNKPDPKHNLGMVMEAVGKLDEAAAHYEDALTLAPDDPDTIANLARTLARRDINHSTGRTGDARRAGDRDRLRELLNEIILKDTRPEWITWAKDHLAILGPMPTTQDETR